MLDVPGILTGQKKALQLELDGLAPAIMESQYCMTSTKLGHIAF